MTMQDIILKKRMKKELTTEEIQFFVNGYTGDIIPDYQMSALLMAICINGMQDREIADLTMAMAHSGDIVDLSSIPGIKVDKHSTGGVGDTTTLIVAPLVAACGAPVAKMSGRGLGHTGGTIDKLESLPGIRAERSISEFIEIVKKIGIAVVGQSGNLDPADKKIYALRDVTGTVNSIALIASSIMSKKIAAGSDAIVLDIKTGSGAFMQTTPEAVQLAEQMVAIGTHVNRKTVGVVTDMNQPLGRAIGNEWEVREAIEVLRGEVDLNEPLVQVSLLLGKHMLILAGKAHDEAEAENMLIKAIQNGTGLEKFRALLIELGNDGSCVDNPKSLGNCSFTKDILAPVDGYLTSTNATEIGAAAQMLGAGRATKEDVIDYKVGIYMHKRCGDPVKKGEVLCTIYYNDLEKAEQSKVRLEDALQISSGFKKPDPMVYGVVTEKGVQMFD